MAILDDVHHAWEWPSGQTHVLAGRVLGIIGLGRIGRHVARHGAAFGMRVVAWSPRLTDAAAEEGGAARRELDALLAEADVVSIHASLKPESKF